MKATGNKIVLERLQSRNVDRLVDNIIIPAHIEQNERLSKAKILSIGSRCKDVGLKIGDIVSYDTMSVFYDTHPIVITKIENIILKEENK